jgi:hypothetical protein
MNKKVATLNVPAIWRRIPTDKMNTRKYDAFPYEQDGEVKSASSNNPVTRYAQNFTKGELSFSLCMFSDETSKTKVEAYFKKLVKDLTESQVSMALVKASGSSFMYLEKEAYGGGK